MLPYPSLPPASQLPLERTLLTLRPSGPSKLSPPPPATPRPLAQSCVQRPFSIQSMVPPVKMWTSLGTNVLSHPLTTAPVLSQDRTCFKTRDELWTYPS